MFSCGATTHIGNIRKHNEDSYLADPDAGMFVVADGMGGHAGGEIASAIVVETIETSVSRQEDLEDAVQQAHFAVLQAIEDGTGKFGMGTTVVCARFLEGGYKIVWVGDSRAYIWDATAEVPLHPVTKDHSLVQVLVDMGKLEEKDVRFHPRKNIITQYVGDPESPRLKLGVTEGVLGKQQKMILCSDGLTDLVGREEMIKVIDQAIDHGKDDQALAERLTNIALINGGSDNVTVLVISRNT